MAARPLPDMSQSLLLEIRDDGEAISVKCVGKINSQSAGLFKSEVKPLATKTKRLVLDLEQVDYMDSSGLGALVGLWVSARNAGCQLRLRQVNDRIHELLRITKLLSVFEPLEEHR